MPPGLTVELPDLPTTDDFGGFCLRFEALEILLLDWGGTDFPEAAYEGTEEGPEGAEESRLELCEGTPDVDT